ncbi:PucR family transcriptional regulator ligand-binding domain-containing protein [Enterococcus casseliflavus]|nr:PucR family transcriptional regulator ligand-binding domain-containing protein [Enterococcus casseliflavus]
MILTSFYAFKDQSPEELRVFFEKMQQIGVSGLVIKVDRLIPMIPDWVIELSFAYQIPLIKVQQEVSYEAIMLAVYEPLLNHQTQLLRTYYEVRQRFMKVERNHSSFDPDHAGVLSIDRKALFFAHPPFRCACVRRSIL